MNRESLFSIEEVLTLKPGYREVLIKVKAVGVCHSDLHMVDGEIPVPRLPLILGHEIAGVVEEVVRELKILSR